MAGEDYSAGGHRRHHRRHPEHRRLRPHPARDWAAWPRPSPQGTTYLETKTGYGLDVENEARSARIASTVADEVTYLGAHLVPAGMDAEEYTDAGLRADARRGPPLRPLGRRLLRTGRLHRGPVPPRAPGLPGCRAGAARARQPARRGPRRAAGGRIRRRERGPRELPLRRGHRRPGRELVRLGRRLRARADRAPSPPACRPATSPPASRWLPAGRCSTPACSWRWPPTATPAPPTRARWRSASPPPCSRCASASTRPSAPRRTAARWRCGRESGNDVDGERAVGSIAVGHRADLHLLNAPSATHLAYRPGIPLTHAVWRAGVRAR